ncbi:MAG: 30S ribosomal protein S18 [Elusimicrobia bacterium CG08_land_8_20_14_0_20_59_10]|nr:MAG: 30S ribosomal protein S18 [Elusimicrobia bacterium CG08_land_8_20_14_0_20_59_10]
MENNEPVNPKPQEAPKPATAAAPLHRAAPGGPGPRRSGGPGGRRHFAPRRKVCRLCAEHIDQVDYKQMQILKSFCTDTGKMLSRRITGACAKHQRQIMRAVKINRNLSLMPYG